VSIEANMAKTDSKLNTVAWNQPKVLPKSEEEANQLWTSINWKQVETVVFKLQKRIYSASRQNDVKRVRQLQKTLLKSYYAKLLAVRRVTQDNQGKKTAGVDGVKSLKTSQRLKLIGQLKLKHKAMPTRRVWIPKPGKEEKRPLGIPTIADRAVQALVKLALEPEWEAVFEPSSYGFRPGRKAQDALCQIKDAIKHKAKYVLDADIAQCFDKIDHAKLLDKAGYSGKIRRQLKAWLKSGVVDQEVFSQTLEGTPQGGIISPLLANIALHGMENRIKEEFPADSKRRIRMSKAKYGRIINQPTFVRYADDFVVLCEDKRIILRCREILEAWLKDIGLEIKPSKTRITHTLNREESEDGKAGFNFLGYHIQQFPVSVHKQHTISGQKVPYKTYLTPSLKNQEQHRNKIKATIKKHRNNGIEAIIKDLNLIIKGWCKYFEYSDASSQGIFSKMSWNLILMMKKWAKRKCKNRTKKGLEKYLKRINNCWRYALRKSIYLSYHSDFHANSTKYIKVAGDRSPYDGDKIYWSTRLGRHPETPNTLAKLLKRQKGKCTRCGLHFFGDELIEIDHIIPKFSGGNNSFSNLQALHRHCHDDKTRDDMAQTQNFPSSTQSHRTT
jgi:RNA-directed DNA polymerase